METIQSFIKTIQAKPLAMLTCKDLEYFCIQSPHSHFRVMEKHEHSFYFTDGEKIIDVEEPELMYMLDHLQEVLPFTYDDEEMVATFEYAKVSRYLRYVNELEERRLEKQRQADAKKEQRKQAFLDFLVYHPTFSHYIRQQLRIVPEPIPFDRPVLLQLLLDYLAELVVTNKAETTALSFYLPHGDTVPTWADELTIRALEHLFGFSYNDTKYQLQQKRKKVWNHEQIRSVDRH